MASKMAEMCKLFNNSASILARDVISVSILTIFGSRMSKKLKSTLSLCHVTFQVKVTHHLGMTFDYSASIRARDVILVPILTKFGSRMSQKLKSTLSLCHVTFQVKVTHHLGMTFDYSASIRARDVILVPILTKFGSRMSQKLKSTLSLCRVTFQVKVTHHFRMTFA